jgi:hypothetical protein
MLLLRAQIPKVQKIDLDYFFALLQYVFVKALIKHIGDLTPVGEEAYGTSFCTQLRGGDVISQVRFYHACMFPLLCVR